MEVSRVVTGRSTTSPEDSVVIKFQDVTLRDGNHALRHSMTPEFVASYCRIADKAGVYSVEVGHGNGIGASSFLIGKASHSDRDLLSRARSALTQTRLGVHVIPGFATAKRDIQPAIDLGVDVFRIGTHATEATTARKHIEYLRSRDAYVQGVLMMSHSVSVQTLVSQAKLLRSYGADAVVIMDSAGNYIHDDVRTRINALVESLDCGIGFHAHNNLGVGISNSLAAIDAGASFIDGSAMGLGAGAGNAALEAIVAIYRRRASTPLQLQPLLDMSSLIETTFRDSLPRMTAVSIQSGNAGVFSGFAPHVKSVSQEYGISQEELWTELGKRRLVAGQESMIREVAKDLMNL